MSDLSTEGFSESSLARWDESDRSALFEAVDATDYSLADWLEALAAFDAWLASRGERRRPWREMTGYIHCCTRMTSAGVPSANLKVTLIQALTEFGFRFIEETQD